MIENQEPLLQIISFVIAGFVLKKTAISVVQSLLGANRKLSSTEKVRERVLARFERNRIQ